ncbi:MAG: DUF6094 domain-containing protein [Clostridiales bacterium]|nr:DUF6094 domain-containing protein [Clostridiales bacterium]MCF8023314.1 DUF6094 domain-containing protein [Clostridiales bacterium]
MARLESREKGGYYPTPEKQLEYIVQKLNIEPGTKAALLDPCCGDGCALKTISDHLNAAGGNVTSYGIELEKSRAEKARGVLDYAVGCDYARARTSKNAFSFLWLNPPYDKFLSERAEVAFLRDLTDPVKGKLMTGGILGYCVPQKTLYHAAPVLTARFDNLTVYKFTEEDFTKYGQVVVFGVRRKRVCRGENAQETREWLKMLSESSSLPSLDGPGSYMLPESEKEIIFKGSPYDPEEIAKELPRSPVWEEVEQTLVPDKRVSILKSPVLPLKPAHDATAIAAGVVGGNMGTHLLVGRAKKVADTKTTLDRKTEREKVVETERYVTTVKIFTPSGIYDLE